MGKGVPPTASKSKSLTWVINADMHLRAVDLKWIRDIQR